MKEYFHAWNLVFEGLPRAFWTLLKYFSDPKYAWEKVSDDELLGKGISKEHIRKLRQLRQIISIRDEYKKLQKSSIKMLTIRDRAYPTQLRSLNNHLPPVVIYYKGKFPSFDNLYISIVGTREMTGYGEMVTRQIVKKLSVYNIVIVSGMAQGIDTTAHKAALENKIPTVAVLGFGINKIPYHLMLLIKEILKQGGAVISEFPPLTSARKHHFPLRNRIISGLSKATIVTEAGEISGAKITAQYCLDQGREVFAVPGNINNEKSKGTNLLIQRSSAHPLLEPEDILDVLLIPRRHTRIINNFPEDQKLILEFLEKQNLTANELIQNSNLSPKKFNFALTELEMEGTVKKNKEGKYYLT